LFATAGANGHEKNLRFFDVSNHEVVRLEKNSSEFFE